MIATILGAILFLAPFCFVGFFENKKHGFVLILFCGISFLSILGFILQGLGVFCYWVFAPAVLSAEIAALFLFFRRREFYFKLKDVDWMALFVFCVAMATLFHVHYNYTGEFNLATDQNFSYHDAKNMVYPYPYYSDEWYSVSLADGAITSHGLPLIPTISRNIFLNMELFFHSFMADIFLLLKTDVLSAYVPVSLFLNCLIIVLAYVFLRFSGLKKMTSTIPALLLLYITCGANLPGFWHFIPFNLGILFFLLSLCFMREKFSVGAFCACCVGSVFYPPMIIFFWSAFIAFFGSEYKNHIKKHARAYTYWFLALLLAIPAVLLILLISPIAGAVNYIFSRLFFVSLSAPFIPRHLFYYIIPWLAIILFFFGVRSVFRGQKWFLLPFILGAIFWFFYSFTTKRFFMEYERVVVLTSAIVCLIAGFGLQRIEKFAASKNFVNFFEAAAIVCFVLLAPFYTQLNNWQRLELIDPKNNLTAAPKAPANNYLVQSDIDVFEGISGKRFLSLPWKGLVVGVATGNYPAVTKEGTASLGKQSSLVEFESAGCSGKKALAKKMKLDYIYLCPFDCPGFEEISKSPEGLVLYKFN